MSAREDVEMRVQALEGCAAERPRRRSARHGSKSRACPTGRASSARRAARRCGNGRGANAARAVWPPRSAPARCRSASAPSEPRDALRGVAQATGAAQCEHDAGGWSHGTAWAGGRPAGWGRSPPGRWGEGRAGVERPRTPAEKEACGCAHRRGRRSTSRFSFADAPASLAAVGGELKRAQGRSVARAGGAGLTLTLIWRFRWSERRTSTRARRGALASEDWPEVPMSSLHARAGMIRLQRSGPRATATAWSAALARH